jgi:4-diphosphocytidyl-2-C-methyl-D-erythritol kinase
MTPVGLPRFPAPAKINRFLRITGRRADGYHELQTVFQFLGLSDHLCFEPLSSRRVEIHSSTGIDLGPPERNLCVRAIRVLEEVAGQAIGVRIHLEKNIPVGGGLGGGSSDAATTLLAVNHLLELGLSRGELLALAPSLGADVPVFVSGHAAWAEGTGERLTPMAPATPFALVVDPAVHVSTAELFGASALTRDCQPVRITSQGFHALGNVFESLVRERYPRIDRVFSVLEAQGAFPRLSGSGGCVFVLVDELEAAEVLRDDLPRSWRMRISSVLNRSPLHEMMLLD